MIPLQFDYLKIIFIFMSTVTLRELRENVAKYAAKVARGESFVVIKRSKPLFKIGPLDEGRWETLIDFTTLHLGGVSIDKLLSRL